MSSPQPPDFAAFFAHALDKLDTSDEWDDSALHASDLGSTLPGEGCLRKIYLRRSGAQGKPESVGKKLQKHVGKLFHVFLQNLLGEYFDDFSPEWDVLAVEAEAPVEGLGTGTLDVLLKHIPTNTLLVLDFKTQSGKGFIYLQKEGKAKPAHVLQVRRYMMSKSAEMGVVIYVDREGSGGFWPRDFTTLLGSVIKRDDASVRTAYEALDAGTRTLPPPPPPASVMVDQAGGGKVAQAALPWFCQYHNSLGEVERCPFLDTVHCGGALPVDQRPMEEFVWRKAKITRRKGGA